MHVFSRLIVHVWIFENEELRRERVKKSCHRDISGSEKAVLIHYNISFHKSKSSYYIYY